MATITTVAPPRGKLLGIFALIAAGIPLPWLFTLDVLSLVVQANPNGVGGTYGPEYWMYGFIAAAGLLFFPVSFLIATALGISAVRSPRRAGKVMGWIALAIVTLAIPLVWLGYGVWIVGR